MLMLALVNPFRRFTAWRSRWLHQLSSTVATNRFVGKRKIPAELRRRASARRTFKCRLQAPLDSGRPASTMWSEAETSAVLISLLHRWAGALTLLSCRRLRLHLLLII